MVTGQESSQFNIQRKQPTNHISAGQQGHVQECSIAAQTGHLKLWTWERHIERKATRIHCSNCTWLSDRRVHNSNYEPTMEVTIRIYKMCSGRQGAPSLCVVAQSLQTKCITTYYLPWSFAMVTDAGCWLTHHNINSNLITCSLTNIHARTHPTTTQPPRHNTKYSHAHKYTTQTNTLRH
jgi:hypothetical protein